MQGKSISGFTLQRLLGKGGMAEVWYAENEIHKRAAVKILNPDLSQNETVVNRFRREAEIMVQLEHPNIRSAYSLVDIDGRPAIIMEYLEGTDLKKMLEENHRFTQEELVKWWNQLVDALNYAHNHELKVVHRDIKPSNIFIDRKGNVKLFDFGIAKVTDTTTGTQTGSTLGTRIYMSPEQVKDPKRVGPASDVYSLAVSFVHLLTGKAPYDSTTSSDYDIQVSIVTKPVDMSKVPAEWRGFLAPYLAKNPEARPALRPFEVDTKTTDTDKTELSDDASVGSATSRAGVHSSKKSVLVEFPEYGFRPTNLAKDVHWRNRFVHLGWGFTIASLMGIIIALITDGGDMDLAITILAIILVISMLTTIALYNKKTKNKNCGKRTIILGYVFVVLGAIFLGLWIYCIVQKERYISLINNIWKIEYENPDERSKQSVLYSELEHRYHYLESRVMAPIGGTLFGIGLLFLLPMGYSARKTQSIKVVADYISTRKNGRQKMHVIFVKDRKFGVLNANFNNVVVPPKYDKLSWTTNKDMLMAEKDGESFLIDIYGVRLD